MKRKSPLIVSVAVLAAALIFFPPHLSWGNTTQPSEGLGLFEGNLGQALQAGLLILQALIFPAFSWILTLNKRIASQEQMIKTLDERLKATETNQKVAIEAIAKNVNDLRASIDKLNDRIDRIYERTEK